jgi:GNAT superfamily N-acetyltransferase
MTLSAEFMIREAERDDVQAIGGLAEEFARYMRELGDMTSFHLNAETLERDGFSEDPAFQGVVVEVADKVVGYLLYHAGYDTDAACRLLYVVDLYVAESQRNRGLGAALMQKARKLAANHRARQIVWTVDRRNRSARNFYEHIGALRVEDLELMYLDV